MKHSRFFLVLVLCVLLAATPSLSLAQIATLPGGDWSAVRSTPSGEQLTVELKDGRTVKGKISEVSDARLTLVRDNKATDLKRDEVKKVYHLTGRTRKKSTLIGAAVGAGAGAAFGAGFAHDALDPEPNVRNRGRAIVGTSLLAAAVFGGFGALVLCNFSFCK